MYSRIAAIVFSGPMVLVWMAPLASQTASDGVWCSAPLKFTAQRGPCKLFHNLRSFALHSVRPLRVRQLLIKRYAVLAVVAAAIQGKHQSLPMLAPANSRNAAQMVADCHRARDTRTRGPALQHHVADGQRHHDDRHVRNRLKFRFHPQFPAYRTKPSRRGQCDPAAFHQSHCLAG